MAGINNSTISGNNALTDSANNSAEALLSKNSAERSIQAIERSSVHPSMQSLGKKREE